MELEEFLKIKNAEIPVDIHDLIESGGNITPTEFESINDVLRNPLLRTEAGFYKNKNGDYLVSMYCPMPEVTAEMISWWFWWHPQKSIRYKIWFPGEHFSVSYSKKDREYFRSSCLPSFRENIQYPVEKIGKIVMPLSIEFLTAEHFGFEKELMKKSKVRAVVCGHVGALYGLVPHTEMAHIFFEDEKGLFMVSRFFIGKRLKNPLLRKIILNDDTARGMAEHCCKEYRNLAERLPVIYKSFS